MADIANYGDIIDNVDEQFNLWGSSKVNNTLRYLVDQVKDLGLPELNNWKGGLDAKLNGFVSVIEYGAKGDGIADDTLAFQDALNTGKHVLIPDTNNHYLITAELISNTAGQYVFGRGIVVLRGSTAQFTFNGEKSGITGITIDSGTDSVYANASVRLNGSHGKAEGLTITGRAVSYILGANCKDLSIRNNLLFGAGFKQTTPIVVSGVDTFIIEGNRLYDVYGFNVQTRWSKNGSIANNTFSNPTMKDTKQGVTSQTVYSFTLEQPAHYAPANGSVRAGIKLNGVPIRKDDTTYPHTIDVTNAPTYGVTFTGTLPASGVSIEFIGWRSLENININSESTEITIIGNAIDGTGDSGIVLCADYASRVLNPSAVVESDLPRNINVMGNVIKNCAYAGIAETHSIKNVSIQGNNILDAGHKTDDQYSTGIFVVDGDTSIVGNIITCVNGYTKYGIHISNSADNMTGDLETGIKIGLNKYKGLKAQNIYLAPSSGSTLRRKSIMIIDGMQFHYASINLDKVWTATQKPDDDSYFTYGNLNSGWARETVVKIGGDASLRTSADSYVNIVLKGKEMFGNSIVRMSFWAKAQAGASAYATLWYDPNSDDLEPGYRIDITGTEWKQYYVLMAVGKGNEIDDIRARIGGASGTVYFQHIRFDYIPF